jgi:UDP-2,3-diacylglucosamine hydrolase
MEILITHGDLLCTDDIEYQKFRKFIRNKTIVSIFNLLSNNIKSNLALYLRNKSKKITSQKPDGIMDVNHETVLSFYKKFKINIIIHGHTHRKKIHKTNSNGKNYIRYVLGDWHNSPSYIVFKNNKVELVDL